MTDQTLVRPDEKDENVVPCEKCGRTDHTTTGHHEGTNEPAAQGHIEGTSVPTANGHFEGTSVPAKKN